MRFAHDSSRCGGSQGGRVCGRGRISPSAEAGFRACGHDQRTEPVWRLCDRPLETFAPAGTIVGRVAAALSAAVTTTTPQETAPHLQAEPTKKKPARQTPAALRERGSGGEALLSEKRPLPQKLPTAVFSGGSAREGTFLQKSPLPRKNSTCYFSAIHAIARSISRFQKSHVCAPGVWSKCTGMPD